MYKITYSGYCKEMKARPTRFKTRRHLPSTDEERPGGFAHVIAVYNPVSSNNKRAVKRITELGKLFSSQRVTLLETTPERSDFQQKLSAELAATPRGPVLVCIGGGDGTVHIVVNSLLAGNAAQAKRVVLLPLWGGNANDFAHMLNGQSARKKLSDIIERAHQVRIYPLQITINTLGLSYDHYAACYASFGASAQAANQLARTLPAKSGRFHTIPLVVMVKEFFNILFAFARTPTFQAEQDGQPIEIFEQIFTNGSRLAKVARLPVRLSDKQFYHAVQSRKPHQQRSLLLSILKLAAGRSFGSISADARSFMVKEPILAQFDGEVLAIASNSQVTIGIAPKYLRVLSTKL